MHFYVLLFKSQIFKLLEFHKRLDEWESFQVRYSMTYIIDAVRVYFYNNRLSLAQVFIKLWKQQFYILLHDFKWVIPGEEALALIGNYCISVLFNEFDLLK